MRWSSRPMAAGDRHVAVDGLKDVVCVRLGAARVASVQAVGGPLFIDKVRDVVGLYLDPPEKVLVPCMGEKSQIHDLDRSQPVLPMMPWGSRAPQS